MFNDTDTRTLVSRSREWLQGAFAAPGTPDEALAQAHDLGDLLRFHEYRYYVLHDPLLSDYEYDRLYRMLVDIEEAFPEARLEDAPTRRVGSDLGEGFAEVLHLSPMLSLDNSYNAEDLLEFDRQVRKLGALGDEAIEYAVEPKYDGGTITLVYQDDRLLRSATRGDGIRGEDISANARTLRSVPLKAPFRQRGLALVELRGEAIIRKDRFEAINALREEQGLALFANPRNAATGGLRMKDPSETAARGLEVFVFQMSHAADPEGRDVLGLFPSHSASLQALEEMGFKVPREERRVCQGIDAVIAFCREWEARRDSYPYEIDGMVVKVNRRELQERCGYTSHHPRWAIAYKFKAKQATSRLLHIDYQVGKTGSITPVAKIEPVPLAGVTVSSVSLHNEEFIRGKDIRLGDMVLVERAGDVIPYIVKPLSELRDGTEREVVFPGQCPVCGSSLFREPEEAAWRCVNARCEAQLIQRIIYHVSKDAMDIEGLGKSTVERFFELGWIRTIADIYRLDYEAIAALEGFGRKSADNLAASIDRARRNPIYRLLLSLSIHHLGKRSARLLAAEIGYVPELAEWPEERFTAIRDIGPVLARNVRAFFAREENLAMLAEMEALGVNMRQTEEDRPKVLPGEGPLAGKNILFTGTLLQMGRKEAQELAEKAGARNISAVSGNLDILVVGENAGSKLAKAQKLGTITILTEEEFLNLLA